MADIQMIAAHHHLDAVRMTALIAEGEMLDSAGWRWRRPATNGGKGDTD